VLYVPLDTNWPDHPKIIRAGIDGAGLHAIVLCLAKRLEADGWVPRILLYRQGATDELIERLVDLDLLEMRGDEVRPDGWLDRNPSQAAISARRASKAEAGKRGNHSKHGHSGTFEECGLCNPKAQVVAGSETVRSQALAVDEPCDPIPTSRGRVEGEVKAATASCDNLHPLAARAALRALPRDPQDCPTPPSQGVVLPRSTSVTPQADPQGAESGSVA
jgi:hypothetical protein